MLALTQRCARNGCCRMAAPETQVRPRVSSSKESFVIFQSLHGTEALITHSVPPDHFFQELSFINGIIIIYAYVSSDCIVYGFINFF